jgi:hypothetical protein
MFSSNSSQVAVSQLYVDDVFSTYLYTGNGSTQTINNGIDLAGKGGMVWLKDRTSTGGNALFDTARGALKSLRTDQMWAEQTWTAPTSLNSFNSNGFSIGGADGDHNFSARNYVSWSFRKAPKFFDVVTFTADTVGNTNQRVSHSLGSAPGTIIIKRTGDTSNWFVYHRSLGRSAYLTLNLTDASTTATDFWGTSDPTTTDFGVLCSGVDYAQFKLVVAPTSPTYSPTTPRRMGLCSVGRLQAVQHL